MLKIAYAQELTSFIKEYCRGDYLGYYPEALQSCIQGIYNLLVALAVLVAFLIFLYGAILYMLSPIPDVKGSGKDKMIGALKGLAIIFIFGAILYWINPNIFNAKLIFYRVTSLEMPSEEYIVMNDSAEIYPGETIPPTINLCPLQNSEGLIILASDKRLDCAVIPHLQKAGKIAKEKYNQIIYVFSAYRSIAKQKVLWEKALKKYGSETIASKYVAPPGKSSHNLGRAVDVSLKGGAANASLLQKIMCEAGWVRYSAEWWHFEYGTKRWEKCRNLNSCVCP